MYSCKFLYNQYYINGLGVSRKVAYGTKQRLFVIMPPGYSENDCRHGVVPGWASGERHIRLRSYEFIIIWSFLPDIFNSMYFLFD